ncbi:MAG: TonB-dependent receptor plug domain-containing protein, partial [Sphingomonadaceae bacterium]
MTLPFLPTPLLLPLLLCLCAAAHAQLAATSPDPVPRVEISGPTATSVRRNDSTLRIVVSRSELAAYGDNSLAAVLQRQPGVSVVGGEIRLRGLGAGYTQLLINGAPAPAGLALDSIAPELIDRIEILRSASAEYSAQGSAGSINLILRKGSRQPRQELKLTVEQLAGRAVPSAALQLSAQQDALGYGLTATLSDSAWRETPHSLERSSTADALRATSERNERQLGRLSLLPRLNWKGSDGATLDWQSLLDLNRDHGHGNAQETLLAGSPSSYPLNAWQSQAHNGVLRSPLNRGQRLAADGQRSVRIGVDHSPRRRA